MHGATRLFEIRGQHLGPRITDHYSALSSCNRSIYPGKGKATRVFFISSFPVSNFSTRFSVTWQ